jgi:hypothetical protein
MSTDYTDYTDFFGAVASSGISPNVKTGLSYEQKTMKALKALAL